MNNHILPIAAVVLDGISILIWKLKELRPFGQTTTGI